MNEGFKVLVPVGPPKKVRGGYLRCVSYPASGQSLYTREQAVNLLKRLYERRPWQDGDEREAWAESERERFTLHFPENLLQRMS
jgi:hypothetical protein